VQRGRDEREYSRGARFHLEGSAPTGVGLFASAAQSEREIRSRSMKASMSVAPEMRFDFERLWRITAYLAPLPDMRSKFRDLYDLLARRPCKGSDLQVGSGR
jgi:hypothetical protein